MAHHAMAQRLSGFPEIHLISTILSMIFIDGQEVAVMEHGNPGPPMLLCDIAIG